MRICDVCSAKEKAIFDFTLNLQEVTDREYDSKVLDVIYLDLCKDCKGKIIPIIKDMLKQREMFSINNYLTSKEYVSTDPRFP